MDRGQAAPGAHFSAAVDWGEPWLRPWREPGEALAFEASRGADLPAVLTASGLAPVCFVPQADLPPGQSYEAHIFATGGVPTREGLHDFFNALCWMRFPQTKRMLNELQARAIARAGSVQGARGPLRDALTLFDENAALLQAPEPIWQALCERDWQRLFVTLRPLWAQASLLLFGHALLEKLVAPYKSITAHVLVLPMSSHGAEARSTLPPSSRVAHPWDAGLSARLDPAWLATKPYTPLPVLGVPGWWPANARAGFYDDTEVFRPPRRQPGPGRAMPLA